MAEAMMINLLQTCPRIANNWAAARYSSNNSLKCQYHRKTLSGRMKLLECCTCHLRCFNRSLGLRKYDVRHVHSASSSSGKLRVQTLDKSIHCLRFDAWRPWLASGQHNKVPQRYVVCAQPEQDRFVKGLPRAPSPLGFMVTSGQTSTQSAKKLIARAPARQRQRRSGAERDRTIAFQLRKG
jgi:hypothetical protein